MIDLIRNWKDERPFCLFMALEMPHPDYGVEDPWFSMIDRDKLPPRTPDLPEGCPEALRLMRERLQMESWNEDRWRELRATYYGMCARVDHQLGLIIDALKEAGHYENTALFCFSDHGDYTGDYGLVQKHFIGMQDCLVRVPLVIKPPAGVTPRPRVTSGLTELIDVTETVYAFAGIDPSYRRFGRDLTPVITGGTESNRTEVYCESGHTKGQHESRALKIEQMDAGLNNPDGKDAYWPASSTELIDEPFPLSGKTTMVRDERYKLVIQLYEPDSFYDLECDPMELCNLIDDPALQPQIHRLREAFIRWQWETDSTVPFTRDARNENAARRATMEGKQYKPSPPVSPRRQ